MTIEHICELIGRVETYGLDRGPHLSQISVEEIAAAYNGIGAAWMPSKIREKITTDYADLEPAAMIHDVDYARASGTFADFHAANARLRDNILKTADAVAFPWISWKWWKLRLAATACFEAVERLGILAYMQACANQKQEKNK